ncbi:MAG TPA: carboxypeptidase-like regulatory domain-containing protein [Bacteroidales bacterium]|nr:carboxypeptidase-like regulatory domain-containing protein [Bacteroidales bacterium]HPJ59523.1 carboxypeptidase-like regulatory domain-containing protein [Bacteroidales bacterium]HPR12060.1 carboxypeptidase-like regulatory domain-containing protein [Bacteroidales bacterium]
MKRSIFTKGLVLTATLALMSVNFIIAQDLASARLLTKSEQYDKADEVLRGLIQKETGNSKNYFFLGENILLNYFSDTISNSLTIATQEAKDIFQKGVEANPNDPLNYVGLAKVAMYLGDNNTATEMRTKARSLLLPYKNLKRINPPAPEYALALAKIAESYINYDQVDTAAALPLIRQALTIDKKNEEIYLIAGDIYMTAIDGSNAIKNYNMAQFANPNSPTANMKIGNVYVRGKNLQVAIPYFEEAINLDPNYAPAYRELGQLFWMAQRLEQSKANFKKYLELTEGNIPAKTRYVNSLFYAGDYDEVIKNVEEILAVDDSRTYMNRLAGYSYYERKNADYDKALYYMDELFRKVAPERILLKDYHYLARILMKKNQDHVKNLDALATAQEQLKKANAQYSAATAAAKPKLKPALDELTAKVSDLQEKVTNGEKELDRGFEAYHKVMELKPQDKNVVNETANYYLINRRYNLGAKTLARLIDPASADPEAYMRVGRAFYNGENFKSADSVFNIILQKSPDYLPAYCQIARTYYRMDPDYKMGLASQKFEKVVQVAQKDSLANESEMMEAFGYLGYYNLFKENYSRSRDFYNRMINLNPNNNDNKIKGYNGLGLIELRLMGNEKTNEGRLPYLSRSADYYNRILALDPNNTAAKNQLAYIRDTQAAVKAGINPNEIRGVVRDGGTGQPIAYASIRVKDTAAEMMSNTRGEFKFEIPSASEVLLVSAKGYQTKEIPITKSRIYNVSLEK